MHLKSAFRWIAAAGAAVLVAVSGSQPVQAATYPNSMEALGDSMTRAFQTCFPWTDCIYNSWATGDSSTVNSYYKRIRALNPNIAYKAYNAAVTGARMSDLNRQAGVAVARNVDLVTILMGNNDACSAGTPVSTFRDQFKQAMDTLQTGVPNADVHVFSVPDIYQLWEIYHTNSSAVASWNTYHLCDELLANPTSTAPADVARRQAFRQRIIDYNTQLANVCAQYAQCTYDGGAGFQARFTTNHVSKVDYFHPSVEGQKLIAGVAWQGIGY